MGVNSLQGISRPFLIGRALDGPLLPTVRAAERVGGARFESYSAHGGNPAHVLAALADTHDALMIIIGTAPGGLMSAIDRVVG